MDNISGIVAIGVIIAILAAIITEAVIRSHASGLQAGLALIDSNIEQVTANQGIVNAARPAFLKVDPAAIRAVKGLLSMGKGFAQTEVEKDLIDDIITLITDLSDPNYVPAKTITVQTTSVTENT